MAADDGGVIELLSSDSDDGNAADPIVGGEAHHHDGVHVAPNVNLMAVDQNAAAADHHHGVLDLNVPCVDENAVEVMVAAAPNDGEDSPQQQERRVKARYDPLDLVLAPPQVQPFHPQQPPPPRPLQTPPRPSSALFPPQRPPPQIPAPSGFTLPPPHRPQIRGFLPYQVSPIPPLPGMPDVPLQLQGQGHRLYQLCRKQVSLTDLQVVLTITGPNTGFLMERAQQAGIRLPTSVNVIILDGPLPSTASLFPDAPDLTLAWHHLLQDFRLVRNQWINMWFELNPPTINIYIRVDPR